MEYLGTKVLGSNKSITSSFWVFVYLEDGERKLSNQYDEGFTSTF